ncbi:MAG: TrkA family potassium uptake protein [Clostridia bacterium]|nr:TrkA family potassium uptake protein [Clostridia bacterium]MEE1115996.1 TrkA family potassium uptake protein [Clostridia bacterium]
MFHKSKKEKNTYGIVGLGRFGHALAMEIAASGADIVTLDRDEEKIREMREYTENAFIVKSLDKKTLSETGIQNCDIAIVCIGEQLDVSILTTLNLVSLGVPHVIAKATSIEHGEILEKLGAEVVYPERDIAIRLAHRLEASRVLDYVQLSEELNISKLMVPESIIGKSVQEVNLRGRFGTNIIAIERNKSINESVMPDYIFKQGDILFVSGSKDGLNRLSEWE